MGHAAREVLKSSSDASLIEASSLGHDEVVKILLVAGSLVNQKQCFPVPPRGFSCMPEAETTPLIEASARGHVGVVRLLLAAGAEIKSTRGGARAIIHVCRQKGPRNTEVLQVLLAAGADPNAKDTVFGNTALMEASNAGNIEVAKLLLAAGADVNAEHSQHGHTSLMRASKLGKAPMVKLLIETGAEVNAKSTKSAFTRPKGQDALGVTALMLAKTGQVAELLVVAGARLELKDERGATALIRASRAGNVKVTKVLVGAGADMSATNDDGTTAMKAAWRQHLKMKEVLGFLQETGAQVHNQGGPSSAKEKAAADAEQKQKQKQQQQRRSSKQNKRARQARDLSNTEL
jgi:ankyrin repeat protein